MQISGNLSTAPGMTCLVWRIGQKLGSKEMNRFAFNETRCFQHHASEGCREPTFISSWKVSRRKAASLARLNPCLLKTKKVKISKYSCMGLYQPIKHINISLIITTLGNMVVCIAVPMSAFIATSVVNFLINPTLTSEDLIANHARSLGEDTAIGGVPHSLRYPAVLTSPS